MIKLEDIKKLATEMTMEYLNQGWIFNYEYMACSNGTYFAAVTDGKDTVVIWFDNKHVTTWEDYVLCVEKFKGEDGKGRWNNIWLDSDRGEVLDKKFFIVRHDSNYMNSTSDYSFYMVASEDEVEVIKAKVKARRNSKWSESSERLGEGFKQAIAKAIGTQGIPGFIRLNASKVTWAERMVIDGKVAYKAKVKDKLFKIKNDNGKLAVEWF